MYVLHTVFITLICRIQFLFAILSSGILGGLVSVTACAPVIKPWEGLLIGFIGGFIANGGKFRFIEILRTFFTKIGRVFKT